MRGIYRICPVWKKKKIPPFFRWSVPGFGLTASWQELYIWRRAWRETQPEWEQREERGRHLEGSDDTLSHCLFCGGAPAPSCGHYWNFRGGNQFFPHYIWKWNNKPKSSKEPERPPEGYLRAMDFHRKAGRLPDILMSKASGIRFALRVPIICSFIYQIFIELCARDCAGQEKSRHRILAVKKKTCGKNIIAVWQVL